ncbi:unnamed protein product [Paramecium sonneborni]|uniref:Transmembrane protein n=1 Tax=Paramecium sonneborni TaxID=65129 RepID=A0A8S1QNT1_9CILI|nr:unnamed protein product [Paramecium sonneborni]
MTTERLLMPPSKKHSNSSLMMVQQKLFAIVQRKQTIRNPVIGNDLGNQHRNDQYQIMNKFTLKFFNSQLELQYQNEKIGKLRKPVFYVFMTLGLILNVLKVLLDLGKLSPLNQYINYILMALAVVLIVISVKWPLYIRYTLLIANISSALLQLNFPENTKSQFYYSYGNNFMQFQACAYFVSDFLDSVVQVICHTIIKLIITIQTTQHVDPQDVLMGIGAAIMIIIVIYICDSNARNEFLSKICQTLWHQQLSELIRSPFFQVTYCQRMLQFNFLNGKDIIHFPLYDDQLCNGCNMRNFLRHYQFQGQELEQFLIKNQEGTLKIKLSKHKFNLRIVNVGIDKINKIIILDDHYSQNITLASDIKKPIKIYIQQTSHHNYQFFFNWGIISLLLINDNTIQEISLAKILSRFNSKFSSLSKIKFLFKGDSTLTFFSYSNLIRVYLIQIYQIIMHYYESQEKKINQKIPQSKPFLIVMIIYKDCDSIVLQLPQIINSFFFISKYTKNFFIGQIEHKILNSPLTGDLKISFNTSIPFKQF